MTIKGWLERTNKFLESNSLELLPNSGNISHAHSIEKASEEYEHFRVKQVKTYLSDLDKEIINMNINDIHPNQKLKHLIKGNKKNNN